MKKKVKEYLTDLESVIDAISDAELKNLVESVNSTPHDASKYAFVETVVLNCVTYSGLSTTQGLISFDDDYFANAA